MEDRAIGHFFFDEGTIKGEVYCPILNEYVFTHVIIIVREKGLVFFQRDGHLYIKKDGFHFIFIHLL